MEDQKSNSNIIFIGVKPFMTYVTSAVMQFTVKNKKGKESMSQQLKLIYLLNNS